MRRILAICMALTSLPLAAAAADDHLVPSQAVEARLVEAARARARDVADVDRALSSPEAASLAEVAGTDVGRLKAAAATLTDEELRDLVLRARALQTDPRAGLSRDVDQLLVIFLIVGIVILLIKAVD